MEGTSTTCIDTSRRGHRGSVDVELPGSLSAVSSKEVAVHMRSRLGRALACSTADVRAAALKALLRELVPPAGSDLKPHLQLLLPTVLWDHLRNERNHKVATLPDDAVGRVEMSPRLFTVCTP